MTGLVGIAVLMERDDERALLTGERARKVTHAASVRKAADWLMAQGRRDGLIFSGHASETSRYMQGHGLATMFLAAVRNGERDLERRNKLDAVLERAVKHIVRAQSSRVGEGGASRGRFVFADPVFHVLGPRT
jgi:hypothetical protein